MKRKLPSLFQLARSVGYGLGMQFEGKRDIYDACGYPQELKWNDYYNYYQRNDLAGRIIDAFADETWRLTPILKEGESRSDQESPTPFLEAWNILQKRLNLFAALKKLDQLSLLGEYAVLFLGVSGSLDLAQELKTVSEDQLIYTIPLSQNEISIESYDEDPGSPRFGLPLLYKADIKMGKKKTQLKIHHSRCLHVVENTLFSKTSGEPKLKRIANRLIDLEKVLGGSSEAVWLSLYRGLAFLAKEDANFPEAGSEEEKALETEIDNYVNGLRRYMKLKGVDVKDLGTDTVDPRGIFDVLLSSITGALGIPKRVLIGSESGQLASTQDDANWAAVIGSRQINYAETSILNPLINWLMNHGVLPLSEEYSIVWPSLFQLTELQKAEYAWKVAQSIDRATNGRPFTMMPPADFAERYLQYLTPDNEVEDYLEKPETEPAPRGDTGVVPPDEEEEDEADTSGGR